MVKITAEDFIKRALGKKKVEVTSEEFIDLIFLIDVNIEKFDLNNPYFLGVKVIITDKVEPRYSVAELEKIFKWCIKNEGFGPPLEEFILETIKNKVRVEEILND